MAESTVKPIPFRQVLKRLNGNGGKIFKVTFQRRNKGKNGEQPGEVREMTCRLHVRAYARNVLAPGIRHDQDVANKTLTVWDVAKFHELRKAGLPRKVAGQHSYRRIPLDGVLSLSA